MLTQVVTYNILGQVLYLKKVVRRILLQVSNQVGLDCLQQAAEAEAQEEWVISFPLSHYCCQLDSQVLLKKFQLIIVLTIVLGHQIFQY